MAYLIGGFAALAVAIVALRAFARANPAWMARRLTIGAGVVLLLAAALLGLRGLEAIALPLGMLASYLLWGSNNLPWLGGLGRSQKSPGQTSRVVTDHLEMELDHDTGAMRGRVLKGLFKDRDIESLGVADMALLWQDCRHTDASSAQIIEAYLDRTYPSWREDMARGESAMHRGEDGRMTAQEAFEILGLKPDASEDAIRRAHRDLMLKLHPDRGGSTYLAAKINEAKDVALEACEG
jgi:DnaJ domain